MCEGETKIPMEGFAFLIEPMVHGAGAKSGLMLSSGVGIRIKGGLL